MKNIKLEYQFFNGCPNHALMKVRIIEAIRDLPGVVNLTEVIVEDDETARRVQFRGSPTLLINGEDIRNMPVPSTFSVSCRYYPDGIPQASEIRQKILERLEKSKPSNDQGV